MWKEIRDSATTYANTDDDHLFLKHETSVVAAQQLFDGFATDAEVGRQASRIDLASFRVCERSEFVALAVISNYPDMLRTAKLLALANEKIVYHQRILGKIAKGCIDRNAECIGAATGAGTCLRGQSAACRGQCSAGRLAVHVTIREWRSTSVSCGFS